MAVSPPLLGLAHHAVVDLPRALHHAARSTEGNASALRDDGCASVDLTDGDRNLHPVRIVTEFFDHDQGVLFHLNWGDAELVHQLAGALGRASRFVRFGRGREPEQFSYSGDGFYSGHPLIVSQNDPLDKRPGACATNGDVKPKTSVERLFR